MFLLKMTLSLLAELNTRKRKTEDELWEIMFLFFYQQREIVDLKINLKNDHVLPYSCVLKARTLCDFVKTRKQLLL